jgi:hypothetical protein
MGLGVIPGQCGLYLLGTGLMVEVWRLYGIYPQVLT